MSKERCDAKMNAEMTSETYLFENYFYGAVNVKDMLRLIGSLRRFLRSWLAQK
jgi:hypothetical protein